MKKITSIITVGLFTIVTMVFSQSSTSKLGGTYFNSDGSSTTKLGDTYFNSNKKRTSTYILDDKKKSNSNSLFDW